MLRILDLEQSLLEALICSKFPGLLLPQSYTKSFDWCLSDLFWRGYIDGDSTSSLGNVFQLLSSTCIPLRKIQANTQWFEKEEGWVRKLFWGCLPAVGPSYGFSIHLLVWDIMENSVLAALWVTNIGCSHSTSPREGGKSPSMIGWSLFKVTFHSRCYRRGWWPLRFSLVILCIAFYNFARRLTLGWNVQLLDACLRHFGKTWAKTLWPAALKSQGGWDLFLRKPGGNIWMPELWFGVGFCNSIVGCGVSVRFLDISLFWSVFCQVVCK